MKYDFDREIERRGTDSYKWDANARLFGKADILPFWVADMDFATPQPILDAIEQRCQHPVFGYGVRSDEYCQAIQDWLMERHDWQVPREWLKFCPPSSIVGIYGIISQYTRPGQTIAAPVPTYGPLLGLIEANGRRLIRNPLREEGGRFTLDTDHLAAQLEGDTNLVVFCSPHNPTGRVFSGNELQALAQLARDRDLLVVSDEVHADLVLPGAKHIPYGSVGGERSVTVVSPNKTFNTAGMPQATLIIPSPEIRAIYQEFLDMTQLNHDTTFGAVAMLAGYRHCHDWHTELLHYIAANHQFAAEFLERHVPLVRKVRAEATYLAWLDFRATGLDQDAVMDRLVNTGGVGLYGGTEFGLQGEAFFRMNLGCPRSRLKQGLEGIRAAMAGLKAA